MINIEKLKIYEKYRGDIDGWIRAGTVDEKRDIDENEWTTIDFMLQRITQARRGLLSQPYERQLMLELFDQIDGLNALELLLRMT